MGAPTYNSMVDHQSSEAKRNDHHGTHLEPNNDTRKDDIVQTYTSLIQQYLSVMCLENAAFLAERLVATDKSSESLYLFALCHYRMGSPQRALGILDECNLPSSNVQYLMAKCCFDLKDYSRAEESLLQRCRVEYRQAKSKAAADSLTFMTMEDWTLTTTPCPVPNGAAGLFLLGCICRRSNRKARAIQYYQMSLKLDPFLWSSFEALCEMGGTTNLDPSNIFGVHPANIDASSLQNSFRPLQQRNIDTPGPLTSQTPHSVHDHPMQPMMGMGTPSSATSVHSIPKASLFSSAGNHHQYGSNTRTSRFETPGLTPIPSNSSTIQDTPPREDADSKVVHRAKQVASRLYYEPSPETPHTAEIRKSLQYLRGMGDEDPAVTPIRRGGRMTGPETSLISNFSTTTNASTVSAARKPRALFTSSESKVQHGDSDMDHTGVADEIIDEENENAPPEEPVQRILELLCLMGNAWWRLCEYRCREALQLLNLLPQKHENTGWVLHQQGRAYFEMNDFKNAQRCLETMQRIQPYRMKGLDLLSTVYWQLKKEVELAHLAQQVVDFDRLSPEAWCVVGNCFSLQKEHETALSLFKRSLQLDPSFTYTHTLSGYEYMANEDFEKAIGCFRNAIRTDERHYNAWYGLGAIYHRQEKYDLAEYHFERAVSINPQSSVLRCNLGIAQFSNGKAFQALDTLSDAFRLDPRNPQARFQRATIYSAMNRPAEALAELEKVRDAAPREATVHFAMGRMLKRLGRPEQAMKCFLTAMDLDPKDNQLIKSAMDKLDEPDVEEEVAVF